MEDGQISTMLRKLVTISPVSRRRQQRSGLAATDVLEQRVVLSAVELGFISDIPEEEIMGLVYGDGVVDSSVDFDFSGTGAGQVNDSTTPDDFGRFSVDYPAHANAGDTIRFRLNNASTKGNWQPYVLSDDDSNSTSSSSTGWTPDVQIDDGNLIIKDTGAGEDEILAVGRGGVFVRSNASDWGRERAGVDLKGREGEFVVVMGKREGSRISNPSVLNVDIEAVGDSLDTYIYQVTTSEGVSLMVSVSSNGNAVNNAKVEIDWNGDGVADAVCTTDANGVAQIDVTGQIPQELVTIRFRTFSDNAEANSSGGEWQSLEIDFSSLDAWFSSRAMT